MKPYEVTLRNPMNGYTWRYYSPEVSSPEAAKRLAEFSYPGSKAVNVRPIFED